MSHHIETSKRKRQPADEESESHHRKRRTSKSLSADTLGRLPRDHCGVQERTAEWIGIDPSAIPNMSSDQASRDDRSWEVPSSDGGRVSSQTSQSSAKSGVYNPEIARGVLEKNNHYGPYTDVSPANEADIRARLARRRDSLSSSCYPDSQFRDFKRDYGACKNEDDIMQNVIPRYFTDYFRFREGFEGNTCARNTLLNKLAPLCTKEGEMMNNLKPDFYRGIHFIDVERDLLDSDLRTIIQGSTGGPVAANDYLEVKGPSGKADVLLVQAIQNGAAGARAMHRLRLHGMANIASADGFARSFSLTYHSGTIMVYVSHVQPPAEVGGVEKTYLTCVGAECMLGSPSQFRAGIALYRNATEEAYKYRRDLVDAANARTRVKARQPLTSPATSQPASASGHIDRRPVDVMDPQYAQEDPAAKRLQGAADMSSGEPKV